MDKQITGIHHVTAIAGDPQRNLDFYTNILGLRLIKLTVNFDDPGTYHFYFGDAAGRPGSVLTFFPWANARSGHRGSGQLTATSFAIPQGSLGWWQTHLKQSWVKTDPITKRFGQDVLTLYDPDDLKLELIETNDLKDFEAWDGASVPVAHAIRSFHHVTLTERDADRTAAVLAAMGFRLLDQEGARMRFGAGTASTADLVDLLIEPNTPAGRVAVGTVHHLAFRTPDDAQQEEWQLALTEADYSVTPVQDRQYFRSIYFREPGGVLFEIATDIPGFTTDETPETLGTSLKLPPRLESKRSEIERILAPLTLPTASV